MDPTPPITPATVAELTLELDFNVPPARVWAALTDELGDWWPEAFYMCQGPGPRSMTLDARPGGQLIEHAGGGNGMVWATVLHVERGATLVLSGSYGSPLTRVGSYRVEANAGGARLRFTEQMFGRVTASELASKDHGWRFLYDGCMRAHLEGSPPPAWQQQPGGDC